MIIKKFLLNLKCFSVFFALILSFSFELKSAESVGPGRLLLNAFSNQCPSVVTRNVMASLGQLQSMAYVVEELKKDNNCSGVAQFPSTLSRYSTLFQNFQDENSNNLEKIELEKRIAFFTILLSDPSLDPTQVSYVKSQIIQDQANLVNARAKVARFQNFSGKEARGANQLMMSVGVFLDDLQTAEGRACFEKKPAMVSSLLSNALLAASAFVSGGTSLALAAGAVVIRAVGKFVMDFRFNSTLNDIKDIEMATALRCVSQSLTDQYCSSLETQDLIVARMDSLENVDNFLSHNSKLQGINLISYQMSSLLRWLEEVYAGSEIANLGDLVNRDKPKSQFYLLDKIAYHIDAYAVTRKNYFANIVSDIDRHNSIVSAIANISSVVESPSLSIVSNPTQGSDIRFSGGGSSVENPILSIYDKQLLPFVLLEPGVHTSVPMCGEKNNPCTFALYVASKNYKFTVTDWENVIANTKQLIRNVLDQVNLEVNKTSSVDPFTILVNAKREFRGQNNPLEGLKKVNDNANRIVDYLYKTGCKDLRESDCHGPKNKYYSQITNILITKKLTNQVQALIEEGMIPRPYPNEDLPLECQKNKPIMDLEAIIGDNDLVEAKSFLITSCISRLLKLRERGIDTYLTKVKRMVSYEMEARYAHNDLGDGVDALVLATRNDLLQSILNSYATSESVISLGELDISLETARNNSKEAMNEFFDFFKKSLIMHLEENRISNGEKNDLCFRSLPYLLDADKDLVKTVHKHCKGRVLTYSKVKNGPAIRFDDYVAVEDKKLFGTKVVLKDKENLRKWFCGYRHYNRANLLLDEQIKNKTISN